MMSELKRSLPGTQRGLGLATALFVITVMALLAALIFQFIRNNAETTEEEISLVRAFYAAESGIQYGLIRVFPPNGAGTTCTAPLGDNFAPAPIPFGVSGEGLASCSITELGCQALEVSGETYYTLTSTGTCNGVSRTIQVRAK